MERNATLVNLCRINIGSIQRFFPTAVKPLAIPEIYWSVFLREDADKIKVSCRSQGDFSVSDICFKYFNGGGHQNAAGGDFVGTMEEAVERFHQVLADLFPATDQQSTTTEQSTQKSE